MFGQPFNRVIGYLATGVVAAGVGVGVWSYGSNNNSSQPNVWVSTTGNDSTCVRNDSSKPCLTFNKAYLIAQQGDTVEVAAGTYPEQVIAQDTAKTNLNDVTFRPASGATVFVTDHMRLGDLGNGVPGASHVTIIGIGATDFQVFTPSKDVTLDQVSGKSFYMNGIQDVIVSNSDWGPCLSTVQPCGNNKIDWPGNVGSPGAGQRNDNIHIFGNTFHDYGLGQVGDHFECMFLSGGTNIVIERNVFQKCVFFDIFIQPATSQSNYNGLRIINNWFDEPWDAATIPFGNQTRQTAVEFSPRGNILTDVDLSFNSFYTTGIVSDDVGDAVYSDFNIVGNIFDQAGGCSQPTGVYFDYNVLNSVSPTCPGTHNVYNVPWVYNNVSHLPGGDWHLAGGTTAADNLIPTSVTGGCPSVDFDNQVRPAATNCDAGSDER